MRVILPHAKIWLTMTAMIASGCHASAPPLRNAAAVASSATSQQAMVATPTIERIAVPEGMPFARQPAKIHVLELEGDTALYGTLSGTGSVKLNDTVLYFTDPAERYYVARRSAGSSEGILVTAHSDAAGNFSTPAVFPKGTPVIANALLSLGRRLTGFGIAGNDTALELGPGSTYVVEFWRDLVANRAASVSVLASAVAMQNALLAQSRRATELIAMGKLPEPTTTWGGDLTMGNGAQLAAKYVTHAFAQDSETHNGWARVFEPHVHALTTLAGNYFLRYDEALTPTLAIRHGLAVPTGITQGTAGDAAIYVAERAGRHLKKIQDGNIQLVAGRFSGDPSVTPPVLSPDGTPLGDELSLGSVQEVQADPAGNLALTFFNNPTSQFHIVGYLCLVGGTYFGRAMEANRFYYLGALDGKEGYVDGPLPTARFRNPAGLTFDDQGNLYVCDRRHNRIRRIAAQSGEVTTVLGDGWPFLSPPATGGSSWDPKSPDPLGSSSTKLTLAQLGGNGSTLYSITDYGRVVDQPVAFSGSGLAASFNRPLALAWRKVDNRQELYIYDSYNNVIRRAVTEYGGSFSNGTVAVVAGKTQVRERTSLGSNPATYSVVIGENGPATEGNALNCQFNLASYDPVNRVTAQVVNGGLAIDRELGRLFIADTNN
ncbi:MAG: hypothetical protein HY692_06685, partial [Cyanobacteria bacterium NC_groundwater_1444_Ag_S-0.65um_54_12]|nr:hypothetical protein [Cyanobacteria bacterium NC_groundwater_1444_Ag_S-0.65um_54_12]